MKIQRAILIVIAALALPALAQAQRSGAPIVEPPDATGGLSNCFDTGHGTGCDDNQCETLICSVDSFCCNTNWDGFCAGEAVDLCPVEETNPRATFTAFKHFLDGNSNTPVEVTINCFTGLPLTQTQVLTPTQPVKFIVESFDDGQLDCSIVEEPVDGYSTTYNAASETYPGPDVGGFPGGVNSDTSCEFDDVRWGQAWSCSIFNSPDPQRVYIEKEWIIEGDGGDELDSSYKLTLYCEDEIIGGYESYWSGNWKTKFHNNYGTSDHTYTADVIPDWYDGTNCWVEEDVWDSSVEVDNNCHDLEVVIGDGDSCTITNTVWFEGIPTLSQYGMAILALLMLGVGFVGFRRFV